jgi:hypothetical protein
VVAKFGKGSIPSQRVEIVQRPAFARAAYLGVPGFHAPGAGKNADETILRNL